VGRLAAVEPGSFLRQRITRIMDQKNRPLGRLRPMVLVGLIVFAVCASTLTAAKDTHASIPTPRVIKVGVLVSCYSATGPSCPVCFNGKPIGFGVDREITKVFRQPPYELYAVIEPDSQSNPEMQKVLDEMGLSARVVDGSNGRALRKLDVIVSFFNTNLRAEVISGVAEAVRHGGRLLVLNVFGARNPGLNEPLRLLLGLPKEGSYLYHYEEIPCQVLQAHPLLEELKEGSTVMLPGVNGWVGEVEGTPLIRSIVDCQDQSHDLGSKGLVASQMIYPLYVRHWGSGTVLSNTAWGNADGVPSFTSSQFVQRCVNWLATQ
jgi:hypothetical protein